MRLAFARAAAIALICGSRVRKPLGLEIAAFAYVPVFLICNEISYANTRDYHAWSSWMTPILLAGVSERSERAKRKTRAMNPANLATDGYINYKANLTHPIRLARLVLH